MSGILTIARCVTDLLWPETCAACGTNARTHEGFCQACARDLLDLTAKPCCPRCGSVLGAGLPAGEDGCYRCPDPMPRFERLIRVGPYAAPLRPAIRRMKYHRQAGAAGHLGRLLAQAVQARLGEPRPDVVLPVPMYWLRRVVRGRNHSLDLAEAVADRLGLPVGGELIRVRNTPPQVGLAASQRARNVRGAFAVTDPTNLVGAHVLLVDDVVTTGATVNEAARTLLSAGAGHVTVAAVAKAEAPRAYAHEADA